MEIMLGIMGLLLILVAAVIFWGQVTYNNLRPFQKLKVKGALYAVKATHNKMLMRKAASVIIKLL